ncbi:ABC transporter permease [Dehalobacterium formicoaceticum]|uniref:ABC transporter permease n=1 Tax=Dehalobacterium formicoaceticum TaxID=51515 RepID=A0ABT1Y396_9FIRM|nr:ABC transporter permease [Dehalobacterium formicoaceticum]MCR6545033.1 ABC transporter permease [Dehalobacterium formicoaceticum]
MWRRFRENKLALAGLIMVIILLTFASLGPLFTPFSYSEQILPLKNKPPGYQFYVKLELDNQGNRHIVDYSQEPITAGTGFQVESRTFWFGSDALGRDLFARTWYGARISLAIGLITPLIVFILGLIYGGISGLIGGWVDEIMMRVVEILSTIPFLLYVILLMVIMEPGLKTIFIAIGAVYWLPMARLVRGQILSLKEEEFVLAARTLGAGMRHIIFRHIMPNCLGPILVYLTFVIPEAIFTESWLSFLGLGISAPVASWGTLASDGIKGIQSYPWQLFFPAGLISLTMLSFHALGDGMKNALDPEL